MLTREEADKIQVIRDTKVACINGQKITAEYLQKWAYRRLETWPDLLASNKILIQQRDKTQQQRDDLLAACENLVRGQLQHPTLRAYVEHAVWVAEQAIAKTKEVKL